MKAETKEQLRARLNIAEDELGKLRAELQALWDGKVETGSGVVNVPRIAAAAFAAGLFLGAVVTLAVRY